MMCRLRVLASAIALSLANGWSAVAPALAEVPFSWAEIGAAANQVELISATGHRQSASPLDCLCPGHTLSTQGLSQAELRFNDGSLARVGERAQLQFLPATRRIRLNQGTALFFVPPEQGRTLIETPNAIAGLQNTGVVVRYVPDRNLTLVMALSNPATGPVAVTTNPLGQEGLIYAGQMALVSDAGLQIVEFDLLEFYRTSRLVQGLDIPGSPHLERPGDPIAQLRPNLVSAIAEQQPFSGPSAILDPGLINPARANPTLSGPNPGLPSPANPVQPGEDLQNPSKLPPGVVMPPSAMPPTPETPSDPLLNAPTSPGNPVTPAVPVAPEPGPP